MDDKIGVLTFHRCINYGSYWQARCLVDALRRRGHDAELIDYSWSRVDLAEWRCALQPVLPTPVPRLDRLLYAAKVLKFFRAVAGLPRSPGYALQGPRAIDGYRLVVVGSDEVWNLHHPWFGGCTLFYGDGIKAERLVAYAASFGNYSAWQGLPAEWAERLKHFDAISVRDENSRCLIQHALGIEPEVVLDPCLGFLPRPEPRRRGPRQPFVAVYGHNFSPAFAREVRRWARARRLKLLSIGYRNNWADAQWLTAGPHDFAQCLARAEAVATNFFHGCIFALRFARPFVCETSGYRSIKVQDLLRLLGGEQRLAREDTPPEVYDLCLSEPPEPEIHLRIDGLRRQSAAYLDRMLARAHG